ncbi:hypothetical protein WL55_25070 [Burkholderia cepacia]|nr:hypothetical protein VL00_05085 [Burkholderia cepacia]KWC64449.1 hypothetical protein WL55_25070 [Burkholderia cepacia]
MTLMECSGSVVDRYDQWPPPAAAGARRRAAAAGDPAPCRRAGCASATRARHRGGGASDQ